MSRSFHVLFTFRMDNRALQERVLEDVVFTLVKNSEEFNFAKLAALFPKLDDLYIRERYRLAGENLKLLDSIVACPPDILQKAPEPTVRKASKSSESSKRGQEDEPGKKSVTLFALSTDEPIVTIHVLDESRDLKSDFNCGRSLLVSEMKYFAEYLPEEESALNEIDISVHCDVDIFGWLMKWVKRHETPDQFSLTQANIIPVLVSADFLQMDQLVNYAAQQTAEFIAKVNLKVLSKTLIDKVANHMTATSAEQVEDEPIREDIYKRLAVNLACGARLFKCAVCQNILPWVNRQQLRCIGKNIDLDRRGNVRWKHTVETQWDFVNGTSSDLVKLTAETKSYKSLYWKIWGLIHVFNCSTCHQDYQVGTRGVVVTSTLSPVRTSTSEIIILFVYFVLTFFVTYQNNWL